MGTFEPEESIPLASGSDSLFHFLFSHFTHLLESQQTLSAKLTAAPLVWAEIKNLKLPINGNNIDDRLSFYEKLNLFLLSLFKDIQSKYCPPSQTEKQNIFYYCALNVAIDLTELTIESIEEDSEKYCPATDQSKTAYLDHQIEAAQFSVYLETQLSLWENDLANEKIFSNIFSFLLNESPVNVSTLENILQKNRLFCEKIFKGDDKFPIYFRLIDCVMNETITPEELTKLLNAVFHINLDIFEENVPPPEIKNTSSCSLIRYFQYCSELHTHQMAPEKKQQIQEILIDAILYFAIQRLIFLLKNLSENLTIVFNQHLVDTTTLLDIINSEDFKSRPTLDQFYLLSNYFFEISDNIQHCKTEHIRPFAANTEIYFREPKKIISKTSLALAQNIASSPEEGQASHYANLCHCFHRSMNDALPNPVPDITLYIHKELTELTSTSSKPSPSRKKQQASKQRILEQDNLGTRDQITQLLQV